MKVSVLFLGLLVGVLSAPHKDGGWRVDPETEGKHLDSFSFSEEDNSDSGFHPSGDDELDSDCDSSEGDNSDSGFDSSGDDMLDSDCDSSEGDNSDSGFDPSEDEVFDPDCYASKEGDHASENNNNEDNDNMSGDSESSDSSEDLSGEMEKIIEVFNKTSTVIQKAIKAIVKEVKGYMDLSNTQDLPEGIDKVEEFVAEKIKFILEWIAIVFGPDSDDHCSLKSWLGTFCIDEESDAEIAKMENRLYNYLQWLDKALSHNYKYDD